MIEELTWTLVTFPKIKVLEKRLLSIEPKGVVVELDRGNNTVVSEILVRR